MKLVLASKNQKKMVELNEILSILTHSKKRNDNPPPSQNNPMGRYGRRF